MIDSAAPEAGLQPFLHDTVICLAAPSFALSSPDGQLRGTGVDGFYDQDRRLLHTLRVLVDGLEPEPVDHCSPGARQAVFRAMCRDAADPTSAPWLLVTRERAVRHPGDEDLGDVVRLHNVGAREVRCTFSVVAATDLADVATVKAGAATDDVPCTPVDGADPGVRWLCPQDKSRVVLRALPGPTAAHPRPEPEIVLGGGEHPGRAELRWELVLAPDEEWSVQLLVHGKTTTVAGYPVPPRRPAPWATPEVTGHPRLAALLRRGLADLEALRLADPEGTTGEREDQFVAAGCPWFLGLFGRDSIWAARMMLPLGTGLAGGTLRSLARRQGRQDDAFTEEAPGRILHELRPAETRHGHGGMVLPARYYGSVDATPLFVVLLHEAWKWGLAESELRRLLPHAREAMGWVARAMGPDDLIRYGKGRANGLLHQGWKDSPDAIRDSEGRHIEPPIALCEVQGYAYQAATGFCDMLTALGAEAAEVTRWRERAERLRAAFHRSFWIDEPDGRRYPAIAVDADGHPVSGPASNMGHLLNSGILRDDKDCRHIAEALVSDELRTPWGIRTRSARLAGFNPFSYHGGSVWAHDSAIAVHGLASAGFLDEAAVLLDGMLDAASHFGYQLPELYAAYPSSRFDRPAPYPPSCRPQAWAAASAALLCSAMLGIEADAPRHRLTVRPIAPSLLGLDSPYSVRGLRLGNHEVEVRVDVHGGADVLGVDGPGWRVTAFGPPTN
ncbi:glycogen debranching N-terminal domain-containing protein [Streptomyces yaanensis]|uniref:Glycogen debranching N-terminal domain-containing protein n=1 Tax=Streptomyces yaanensis TaxID=1142239 RepID=A0ABV7SMP4_9ACTN|nr:glycogen debranching N-terminal domain-containing protein [Streptomyces sp. CGMCC 4.7035]WNB97017.1 glycogen debranching N-terminal domain-containing protein [Streptomyces sp. CGMCC 4.7035]